MDWATTEALMERALVNWRSIKDREPGSDTSDLTLSLDICESAMMEAEEAFKQYVRGKRKPSSIHKPIPRPEQVPTGPSTSPYVRLHKPIPTTSITKTLLPTIPKRMREEAFDNCVRESKTTSIKKTVMPLKPQSSVKSLARTKQSQVIGAKKKATKQSQVIGAKARELHEALEEELAKT